MTPDQVRNIVDTSLRDGLFFPWWSYFLAFALSMLGAYVGAYIKRKAEDRAAQENFNALRLQVNKTTEDAEQIKATLSGKTWLTQQQWSKREQRYSELLTHLYKMKLTLQDREKYYLQPGSEHDESVTDNERFNSLSQNEFKSYEAIRELIGPSSIFLSTKTIDELERLVRKHWSIAEFSTCTADYLTQARKLVDKAYSAVLKEAQGELLGTKTAT